MHTPVLFRRSRRDAKKNDSAHRASERLDGGRKMPHSPDDEKFFRHLNLMPKVLFPNEANDHCTVMSIKLPRPLLRLTSRLVFGLHWLITRKRNYERGKGKSTHFFQTLLTFPPSTPTLTPFVSFFISLSTQRGRTRLATPSARNTGRSSVTCVRRRNMPTDFLRLPYMTSAQKGKGGLKMPQICGQTV